MILTLLNWGWIFFCCTGLGLILSGLFMRLDLYRTDGLTEVVMMGFAAISVYSNIYSLFGGLSMGASILLGVISLIGIILYRGFLIDYRNKLSFEKRDILIGCLITVIMLFLTVSQPIFIDTYLYHAQNIEWMEKYGVVKGLGNLFVNYAYNSVFLQMQALFSWKWLCGQSLHGLNGFLCLFILLHCYSELVRSWKNCSFFLFSNMVRLVEIFYVVFAAAMISSPGTDISALIILLYVIEKWAYHTEKGIGSPEHYGILSLLIIVAAAFKLSVAAMGVLILMPLIMLIKEGRFREIVIFSVFSACIIVPFLLRSYYLSGYLIYPYGSIDVFDVKWKIPNSYMETDINNIISYGRLLNDPEKADFPVNVWFPFWFKEIGIFYKFLFVIDIASIFSIMIVSIIMYKNRKIKNEVFLNLACIIGFTGWMLSAPLVRYGVIFMVLLPLAALSLSLYGDVNFGKIGVILMTVFILLAFAKSVVKYDNFSLGNVLFPADYKETTEEEYTMENGVIIYYPTSGEYPGYDLFPSVPEQRWLSGLSLMGDNLEEGFMR